MLHGAYAPWCMWVWFICSIVYVCMVYMLHGVCGYSMYVFVCMYICVPLNGVGALCSMEYN